MRNILVKAWSIMTKARVNTHTIIRKRYLDYSKSKESAHENHEKNP